jgi:hypothetical protein
MTFTIHPTMARMNDWIRHHVDPRSAHTRRIQMNADPQIQAVWELGFFMSAPVLLAIMLGTLLRWRDRRLERLLLQDKWRPEASTITRTVPTPPSFESVERAS